MLKKPRTKGVNNMQEFKERRQGYKWNDFIAWTQRHPIELILLAGMALMVYIPEIVGFLDGWL